MNLSNLKLSSLVLSAMTISSCGGSNSSTPATPPPPPANLAPVISVTVSNTAPNEGQRTILDASASSDPEGESLSYTWTQLSGPELAFDATNMAQVAVTIPEIDGDVTARIQLTISDGEISSTSEESLNLTNIVLTPTQENSLTIQASLESEKNFADFLTIGNTGSFSELNVLASYIEGDMLQTDIVSYSPNDEIEITSTQNHLFPSNTKVVSQGVPIFGLDRTAFAALLEDKVELYGGVSKRLEISTDTPCGIESNAFFSQTSLIIGKQNGGAEVYEYIRETGASFPNDTRLLFTIGEVKSLCDMKIISKQAFEPLGFSPTVPGGNLLLTFDSTTNTLISFTPEKGVQNQIFGFTEREAIKLITDNADDSTLTFIKSLGFESPGGDGLLLLFADDTASGDHQIVAAGLDGEGRIKQQISKWSFGKPSDMAYVNLKGRRTSEIVVTTPDSPFLVVLEPGDAMGPPTESGFTQFLPLSGPAYIDVGFGATKVSLIALPRAGNFAGVRQGLLLSFPAKSKLEALIEE